MESFARDVRYAARVLAGAPVFTTVVILTLALGIGANTAIFSLIDSIILRSLPVQHPEELVEVTDNSLTNPLWEQVRDRQDVFSGAFAWSTSKFNLARSGVARMVDGIWVSGDFFRTLGINPAAGRLLSTADDQRGCAARAVISHGFWESHYGGAASAIGSALTVNGVPFEVIGWRRRASSAWKSVPGSTWEFRICSAGLMGGRSPLDQRSWWWLRVGGRPKPRYRHGPTQGASGAAFAANLRRGWSRKTMTANRRPGSANVCFVRIRWPPDYPVCGVSTSSRAPYFDGGGRAGAADRLRQYRRPDAGARRLAREGNGHAPGAGRFPLASDARN